jgi:hypothetical protein
VAIFFSFRVVMIRRIIESFSEPYNPHYGVLVSIPATLIGPVLILLTGAAIVTVSTIGQVVILESIIAIVGIILDSLTMFTTSSTNILKPNHRTTTIANHHLFLLVTSYIDIIQGELELATRKTYDFS